MPVISAFGRLRQEDHEFKACLGYIVSSRPARLQNETLSQQEKKKKKKLDARGSHL
jgi:hypothetical protein